MKFAAATLMLAAAFAASASAHPVKHHLHCKPHYVKRTVTIRKHRHGRLVKVHKTVCVKVKVKAQPTPAPQAVAPASRAIKLKAHLDPSFTRDPSDPFKVTYAYSASATSELLAAPLTAEPAPLPEGVLSLYNDGLLACSINVGATAAGGECPVTYSKLGEHTVTTIYSSGATSATETEVEHIEPIATKVTLTASYEPLSPSVNESGLAAYEGCLSEPEPTACLGPAPGQPSQHYEECTNTPGVYEERCAVDATERSHWLIGHLVVSARVTDSAGDLIAEAPLDCTGISKCLSLPAGASDVHATLWGLTIAENDFNLGQPIMIGSAALETQEVDERVVHASWSGSGYLSSEATTPVGFTPAVNWP
ncbi:MAG: hypothetical protein ACRDK4_05070 [Solirubrobacteraceae bacterium]